MYLQFRGISKGWGAWNGLNKFRGLAHLSSQISNFKRGKVQLSDIQKAGIETRIAQLVEINKKLKAQGQGPKLGRPAKK